MEYEKSQSLRLGSKTRTLVSQDLSESLGKVPPQALDLEEAVLGALMLEKDALTNVIDILRPETFYKDNHKLYIGDCKVYIRLIGYICVCMFI